MSESEVIPIIPVPYSRKAKASIWRDIGVAETDHLLRLSSIDETKNFLMETFQIVEDSNSRHLIVLDMFFYAVQFCKENSFNSEKTSCLLSILKQTHEMATETPFGNIRETLDFFKDLVLCHSVHRPPFSLGIFSSQEATAISNYFIDSYFRHFKLYKYIFTPQVQLDLAINYTKFPKPPKESSSFSKSSHSDDPESTRTVADVEDTSACEAHENDRSQEQPEDEDHAAGTGQLAAIEDEAEFDPSAESMAALKRLIRERLAADMQKLQASVAQQLRQSDEVIGKLATEAAVEAGKKQPAGGSKKKK